MGAPELIHEALIYGVPKPCECGGTSFVARLDSYHPPDELEERLERRFYCMMRLRICTTCGSAGFLEGLPEEEDVVKHKPNVFEVEDYDHVEGQWRVTFKDK